MHQKDIITPSFAAGFARNKSESAYPELWDGLIGCWCPFVGPQPGKLLDFSGRRNHGIMTGFTNDAWVPGPRGWALAFAGASEKIVCGTSLYQMTLSRTIIARVRVADLTHNTYTFYTNTIGADSTKSYDQLLHRAAQAGLCYQCDTGPGGALFSSPTANMVANKWHTVAMARDHVSTISNIYQDSSLLDGRNFTSAFANDTGQVFCIGSQDGAGNVLNGAIDMLLLYDRLLRPELINEVSSGATPLHLAVHFVGLQTGTAPTVTTTAISAIATFTATGGGNVTFEGGPAVTARGVCWNTTGSPTTADDKTTDGAGSGAFSSAMTGLLASTTYYVRAYATNSLGTSYGGEESFVTAAARTYVVYQNNRLEVFVEGLLVAFFDSAAISFTQSVGMDKDTYWDTDGSGIPFASMYVADNATATAIALASTYYQVTVFDANGESNDATPDHTNDHITIGRAGRYYISLKADLHDGTVNDNYEASIMKNNGATHLLGLRSHVFFDCSTSEPQLSLSGIADLAANDTIELWVKNNSGADGVTFAFATLSLFMVGGT